MTAGFLQLLQIDGSALPANDGQYHPWNVLGIGEFNCWLGLHRGIFSTSGWGSIVATAGAGGSGPGLCPNKYGERSGCYGCVPTVTVHEVRTLSPQIAPGACECAG